MPSSEELLIEFAKDVIRQSWDGCLDEPYVQELGVKLGLLQQVAFDPAVHTDMNGYAEAGDLWYIFDGPLLAAPLAPEVPDMGGLVERPADLEEALENLADVDLEIIEAFIETLQARRAEAAAELSRLRSANAELKSWQDDQVVLIDDTQALITEMQTDKKAAEASLTALRGELESTRVQFEKEQGMVLDSITAATEDNRRLREEREVIRVEAFEEVAGLAIPVYSYDVAGVRTGIERFRKLLQAYAAKARAALTFGDPVNE